MAAAGAHLPLWDPDNVEEEPYIIHTDLLKVINYSAPTLCKTLQLQNMWPYLAQLQVLSLNDEERIKHQGARPDQVLELLNYIKKGQRWQYHAVMRAMVLTGQGHLVPKGGPGPDVYRDQEPQDGTSDNEPAATTGEEMLPGLLGTIVDHCRYYQKYLMRGHIFALEGDPGGDYIDIKKLHINTDPKLKDGSKTSVPIAATEILEKVRDSDPPLVVQLYGQPGDGKTSFTMNVAYTWSKAFMEQVTMKNGKPSLKSKCPLWTTMIFIKAREINTTIEDAIREGLGCKEEDQDTMMAHIKQGKGVAILVEALDELHNETAIENLKQYVKKCKKNGGPTVLITCRTDLCCIDGQDFDRFLTLEGFTEEQALDYVKLYTETCKEALQSPAYVYEYVTRHKDRMKGVLSNPLQLHLYCALAMRGELELTENSEFNIPKLFGPLEKHLLKRGGVKVTHEQSKDFYRFCMNAILTGIREFPEALLDKFNVVRSYHIFMHKSDRRGPDGGLEVFYSFGHEMALEYFASRHILCLTATERLQLLFVICSNRGWRNIQLIIIHLLLEYSDLQKDLIQTMLRLILIVALQDNENEHSEDSGENEDEEDEEDTSVTSQVQTTDRPSFLQSVNRLLVKAGLYGSKRKVMYGLKQLLVQLNATPSPQDLLCPHSDSIPIMEVTKSCAFINAAFDKHPDILRDQGLYWKADHDGTMRHVVQCLEACPPGLRQELVQSTILPLLPSESESRCACAVGGGTRWAVGSLYGDITLIMAWCPSDAAELVVHPAAVYKKQTTSSHHSLWLSIDQHAGLWGEPDAAHWSQDEWTRLLLQLPRGWLKGDVCIWVHGTAPLTGLLSCLLHHVHLLSQCGRITVFKGRTELAEHEDLINLVQECLQAGIKLELTYTTIVAQEGADRDQVSHLLQSTGVFWRYTIV